MFGILGEDDSDVKTLKTIIRRIVNNNSIPIKGRGYDGCDEMLRKGAKDLKAMWAAGRRKFIVCLDADGPDPEPARATVRQKIVKPSQLDDACCIVVPVEEIEAWILADLDAVRRVISKFPQHHPIASPENVPNPKEHLERLSKDSRGIRLYEHSIHNEKVAMHLDLGLVKSKCHSYQPFENFVRGK